MDGVLFDLSDLIPGQGKWVIHIRRKLTRPYCYPDYARLYTEQWHRIVKPPYSIAQIKFLFGRFVTIKKLLYQN